MFEARESVVTVEGEETSTVPGHLQSNALASNYHNLPHRDGFSLPDPMGFF